jgi:hypothetical protein
MAQNALAQIRSGLTINIAGLEISQQGAVYQRLFRKDPVYVWAENFGACAMDGYNVEVVDRAGKRLFRTSDDSPNALLLPYILRDLYGR